LWKNNNSDFFFFHIPALIIIGKLHTGYIFFLASTTAIDNITISDHTIIMMITIC